MKVDLTLKQEELFKKVQAIFPLNPVYLVGGAVRDILMKVEPHDYDFCIGLNPEMIQSYIKESGRRAYLTGKKFGTIGCKIDSQMIEVTSFRTETYEAGNRKPEVEYTTNLTLDLSRRDFTINAMAVRMDNSGKGFRLIDPYNGLEDLKKGVIRCVGTPKLRFKEDPLRILRMIRFATKLKYGIEEITLKKASHMTPLLLTISKERWVSELDKILTEPAVYRGLMLLWNYDCFKYMIPELSLQLGFEQDNPHHSYTLECHTGLVVQSTPPDINMRWLALLHDIGKPFTKVFDEKKGYSNYINHDILGAEIADRICRYLKFSNERREFIVENIKTHLEPDSILRPYDNGGK